MLALLERIKQRISPDNTPWAQKREKEFFRIKSGLDSRAASKNFTQLLRQGRGVEVASRNLLKSDVTEDQIRKFLEQFPSFRTTEALRKLELFLTQNSLPNTVIKKIHKNPSFFLRLRIPIYETKRMEKLKSQLIADAGMRKFYEEIHSSFFPSVGLDPSIPKEVFDQFVEQCEDLQQALRQEITVRFLYDTALQEMGSIFGSRVLSVLTTTQRETYLAAVKKPHHGLVFLSGNYYMGTLNDSTFATDNEHVLFSGVEKNEGPFTTRDNFDFKDDFALQVTVQIHEITHTLTHILFNNFAREENKGTQKLEISLERVISEAFSLWAEAEAFLKLTGLVPEAEKLLDAYGKVRWQSLAESFEHPVGKAYSLATALALDWYQSGWRLYDLIQLRDKIVAVARVHGYEFNQFTDIPVDSSESSPYSLLMNDFKTLSK